MLELVNPNDRTYAGKGSRSVSRDDSRIDSDSRGSNVRGGRITKKLIEVLDGKKQLAFSQIIDEFNSLVATGREM